MRGDARSDRCITRLARQCKADQASQDAMWRRGGSAEARFMENKK